MPFDDVDTSRFASAPWETHARRPTVEELLAAIQPPGWHADGTCHGRGDVDWFPTTPADAGPALAVCAGCPVRASCGAWAVRHQAVGVWGGVVRVSPTTWTGAAAPLDYPPWLGMPTSLPAALVGQPQFFVQSYFARKAAQGGPVRCSCGRRCRTAGLWRNHSRQAIQAHPDQRHDLDADVA